MIGGSKRGLTRRQFAALSGSAVLAACTRDVGLLEPLMQTPSGPLADVASRTASTNQAISTSTVVVELDPANPEANFTKEGNQAFAPSPGSLGLKDASPSDIINFFAADSAASPGNEIDVVTTFKVDETSPVNADAGYRIAINDGLLQAAIAACVVKGGVKGIGLASPGQPTDPNTYPVFVPVEWQAAAVSLRLRRTATDDCELIEVNGASPSPRAILTKGQLAPPTRVGATVEFGCASVEAAATITVFSYRSEVVPSTVAGKLTFTRIRIRDSDSIDKLRFRVDYALGASSNGIDPQTQAVTIKLSTAAGVFYERTIEGFNVRGQSPRRRWSMNDTARAASGIERLEIDEDPGNTGGIFLVDVKTEIGAADFSKVTLTVTIGDDSLTGTAQMVEKPAGSGKWRFVHEP